MHILYVSMVLFAISSQTKNKQKLTWSIYNLASLRKWFSTHSLDKSYIPASMIMGMIRTVRIKGIWGIYVVFPLRNCSKCTSICSQNALRNRSRRADVHTELQLPAYPRYKRGGGGRKEVVHARRTYLCLSSDWRHV